MKKKTIILLISILLAFIIGLNFNFNYAAAGDYYEDLTEYKFTDINKDNAAYVANLAKEYIKAHPELYNKTFTPTDNMFDKFIIYSSETTDRFSIHFIINDVYPYIENGYIKYSVGAQYITLVMNSKIYFVNGLTSTGRNSLTSTNLYHNFNLIDYTDNTAGTIIKSNVINYINTYEPKENPTFDYHIKQDEYGYRVAITPLNINYPCTLIAYFNGNYDNYYTLQNNVATLRTSNFIINSNIKKVLFVCEHPDGAFSLEVNLSSLNFDDTGSTSGSGGNDNIDLDEFYGTNVYITAKSVYNVTDWVTTITTHNMQSDYKLYYSYDGGVTLHDMGYKYGANDYVITTIKGEANKVLFLVEDSEEGFIYTLDHVFYDTSFGAGNLFGDVESSVDIENFTIDDGIANIKNFFYSVYDIFMMIIEFITCLPMWIVVPLNTFLIVLIILAVIEFIRG